MKKIKTRLQLTKTTVRVLRDADLAGVHGGLRTSSDDPAVCRVGVAYGDGDGKKR